ncbi:hypothetical protein [Saccharothrix coeruleofusca]|nr:hypothetical protein [Saccharothrix coeruleofusca]
MNDEPIIRTKRPKREWLLRCEGEEDEVFSVNVSRGAVEIHPPEHLDCVHLEKSQIAEFRAVLDEAIERAETDLRAAVES